MDSESQTTPGDDSGSIVSTINHLPFGGVEACSGAEVGGIVLENWYGFIGKESEQSLGIYYYGARYYNSQIGRWLSVDPFELHYRWILNTQKALARKYQIGPQPNAFV